jgi:hypothetical protein
MARKLILDRRNGVSLIKKILYDGAPRKAIGASYVVCSPRYPSGHPFDTLGAARKFFGVQASFALGRARTARAD